MLLKYIPRIRILTHDQNEGVGASRNTGLLASKGDIVLMIDADGSRIRQSAFIGCSEKRH
ncbi:MAG: glycosyltransferase [Candidatus Omnitrophica bacterium]|nr:glycosyltransferase [Candidatus Omnitrophota bacterium]